MIIQNIADNFTDHFRSTLGPPASDCFRTEPKLFDLQSVCLLLSTLGHAKRFNMSSEVVLFSVMNLSSKLEKEKM